MLNLHELRYKAVRSNLRAPLAWLKHRGLLPHDVFLASYERSGSTWLRFILCEILTGDSAAFERINNVIPELGAHQHVAPVLPAGRRLIKTHEPYRREYRRAIYLSRDLRDVLLSNYARNEEMGFAAYFANGHGFDGYLEAFMQGRVTHFGSWQQHVTSWLDSPPARGGDLLVVRFEDLRRDSEPTLVRILSFLGVTASRAMIQAAIANNTVDKMRAKEDATRNSGADAGLLRMHKSSREDGRFVRQGAVGGWRGRLTTEQLVLIERYAGAALARLGYPSGNPVRAEQPNPAREPAFTTQ